ncbi:unknown [Prevotella sp. CAG:873]|nr:unknown [Prevotella sp. CAG:873]
MEQRPEQQLPQQLYEPRHTRRLQARLQGLDHRCRPVTGTPNVQFARPHRQRSRHTHATHPQHRPLPALPLETVQAAHLQPRLSRTLIPTLDVATPTRGRQVRPPAHHRRQPLAEPHIHAQHTHALPKLQFRGPTFNHGHGFCQHHAKLHSLQDHLQRHHRRTNHHLRQRQRRMVRNGNGYVLATAAQPRIRVQYPYRHAPEPQRRIQQRPAQHLHSL